MFSAMNNGMLFTPPVPGMPMLQASTPFIVMPLSYFANGAMQVNPMMPIFMGYPSNSPYLFASPEQLQRANYPPFFQQASQNPYGNLLAPQTQPISAPPAQAQNPEQLKVISMQPSTTSEQLPKAKIEDSAICDEKLEDTQVCRLRNINKPQLPDPSVEFNNNNNNNNNSGNPCNNIIINDNNNNADLQIQTSKTDLLVHSVDSAPQTPKQKETEVNAEGEHSRSSDSSHSSRRKRQSKHTEFLFFDSKQKVVQISNIVRNITLAFTNFLEDCDKHQAVCEDLALQSTAVSAIGVKVQKMLRVRCCNNLIIKDFIKDSQIAPIFKYFLQNHAREWVQKSKIRDKNTYEDIIVRYLRMSQEPEINEQAYTNRTCRQFRKQ